MSAMLLRALMAAGLLAPGVLAQATSIQDGIHLTETITNVTGTYRDEYGDEWPCMASGTSTSSESFYVNDVERIINFRYSSGKAGEFRSFNRYGRPDEVFGRVVTSYSDDYGTTTRFKGTFLSNRINDELHGTVVISTYYGCTFYSRVRGALALPRRVIELQRDEADAKQWFDTGEAVNMINNFLKDKVLRPLVNEPEGGMKEGVNLETRSALGAVRG